MSSSHEFTRRQQHTKETIMPNHRAFIQPAVAAAAPTPHIARRYACLLLCGLSLGFITTASAEELSVDEMACALDPQCTAPVVDRRLRGITTTPSVRTPGSFDRTVNFAFDSAELTADAARSSIRLRRVSTASQRRQVRHRHKWTHRCGGGPRIQSEALRTLGTGRAAVSDHTGRD